MRKVVGAHWNMLGDLPLLELLGPAQGADTFANGAGTLGLGFGAACRHPTVHRQGPCAPCLLEQETG